MSVSGNGKRIGFIINYLNGYQERLWVGATGSARANGASLISFVGRSLKKEYDGLYPITNRVYELAQASWIDSYLLSGNTLGNYLTRDEFREALKPYETRPAMSIGSCPGKMPSAEMDNNDSIMRLTRHLIRDHGRRKLVFFSGPRDNIEAQERLSAFKRAASEEGIEVREEMVIYENFWYDGGERGVVELLDKRRIKFDGLVSANDYMAIGAQRELIRRGVYVPEEVAVTGYDDVFEAAAETPSLTTANSPIDELAEKAVRSLLDGTKCEKLKTKLIFRASCGCGIRELQLASGLDPSLDRVDDLGGDPERLVDLLSGTVRFTCLNPSAFRKMAESLFLCVTERDARQYIHNLEQIMSSSFADGESMPEWQNALSVLRAAIPSGTEETAKRVLEGGVNRLRVQAALLLEARMESKSAADRRFYEKIGGCINRIGTAGSFEELSMQLVENSASLGMRSCYFLLRSDILDPTASQDMLTLITAWSDGKNILQSEKGDSYPMKEFIPEKYLPCRSFELAVYPVVYGQEFYGVLGLEPGPLNGVPYNMLSYQTGSTVEALIRLAKVRQSDAELEIRAGLIEAGVQPIIQSINETASMAERNSGMLRSIEETTTRVKQEIASTNAIITELMSGMKSVKEFAALIEDISETINLLGLNAAIEAARAGSQGRGFNVIAGEIRKLSSSTRQNAEHIASVLGELGKSMEGTAASGKRSEAAFGRLDAELRAMMEDLASISGNLDKLDKESRSLSGLMITN